MHVKALPALLALLFVATQISHAQTTHILPAIEAAFLGAPAPPPASTTWYVRPDGGPRDSAARRANG